MLQDHQKSAEEKFKDWARAQIDVLMEANAELFQRLQFTNALLNVVARMSNRSPEAVVKELMADDANQQFDERLREEIRKANEAAQKKAEENKAAIEKLAIKP